MIGSRLKEERERLKMTQEAFAAAALIKRRTLVDWEKGVSSPTAVQLFALMGVGVDTHYVISGQRSGVSAEDIAILSRREKLLLDHYRNSPPEGQDAIARTAFAFAEQDKKKAA